MKLMLTHWIRVCLLMVAGIAISFDGNAQCAANEQAYEIFLAGGGSFVGERSWDITHNSSGEVVISQSCGNYTPGTFEFCLIPGELYTFNAYDDYGDGWNMTGDVVWSISWVDGPVAYSGGNPNNGIIGDMTLDCVDSQLEYSLTFEASPPPNCTPPVVSLESVRDCASDSYSTTVTIDEVALPETSPLVAVSAIVNGIQVDGGAISNVVGQSLELGPFDLGNEVIITYSVLGLSCPETQSAFMDDNGCPFNLDCGTPYEYTYCPGNNDETLFLYVNDSDEPISLFFTAGLMEAGWDDIIVYDGEDASAPVLYQGNNGGDLAGLSLESTGGAILLTFDTDLSVSCQNGSANTSELDWVVGCGEFDFPGCTDPEALNYLPDATVDNGSCIYPIPGQVCFNPLEVTSLPFFTSDNNTADYFDDYNPSDRPSIDGVDGNGTGQDSYLSGDDVVYAYTPSEDHSIDIEVTNNVAWTGVFVFTGCRPFTETITYSTSTSATPHLMENVQVSAGVTYYIVISTWTAPQSTTYNLSIREHGVFDCPDLPVPANFGDACDDGDPATFNDHITTDCECVGVVPPAGSTCPTPLEVTELPYDHGGNTSTYLNFYDIEDVPPLAANAITDGTGSAYYLTGNEVVYAYTPTENQLIDVSTTNDDDWIGLWAFIGCPFEWTVGYDTQTNGTTRAINQLPVLEGTTYYFVISTWDAPESTTYTIHIEESDVSCEPPTAGTPVAEFVEICAGWNLNLQSVGATPTGVGIIGEWQSSPPGEDDWTGIPGSGSPNFTLVGGVLEATDFRYVTTCIPTGESDISDVIHVTMDPDILSCYCIPDGSNNNSDEIRNFNLSNIDNASAANEGVSGYADYTETVEPAELTPGETYVATILTGTGSGNHGAAIWIDYNDNGIFDEYERVTHMSNVPGNSTTSFPAFEVENVPGLHRLRVQYTFNELGADLDPCNIPTTWAETEDYMVDIIELYACTGTPSAGTPSETSFTICAEASFALSVTGASEPAGGLIRGWQSSPAGENDWTDIPAGSSPTINLANGITADTDFRYVVTCNNTQETDISDVIQVTLNLDPTQCYCIPEAINTARFINDFITYGGDVNIENTGSGHSPGGYGDFTDLSVSQVQSGSINFTVNTDGGITAGVRIWVDWNQDGVFNTSTEVAYQSTSYQNTQTGTITVPSNAIPGPTRMRVVSNWLSMTGEIDPCATGFNNGEFEDYTFVVNELIPCEGTPSAGEPEEAAFEICAGNPFNITVIGATQISEGLQRIWQSSPAGEDDWTDLPGAFSADYNVAGIFQSTDFRYSVTCSYSEESDFSDVISVTLTNPMECYCTTTYTSTIEPITYVDFGDIQNSSSAATSSPPYEDFTDLSTPVFYGESIPISLQGYTGGNFVNYFTVFIDWNQNGIFDDDGEVYEIGSIQNSSGLDGQSADGMITIPEDATYGNTRMRVVKNYFSSPLDPCGSYGFGQTEDYTLEVSDLTLCSGTPSAGTPSETSIYTCPAVAFTLSVEGASQYSEGLERVWQSSPAGENDWTDLDGPTGHIFNVVDGVSADTDFRYSAYCAFSEESDSSELIQVTINTNPEECYCIPSATNTTRYINNFTTTGGGQNISNLSSGFSENGYGDFTELIVEQGPGGEISFTVDLVGLTAGIRIWVDWNRDGQFDTANEVVFNTNSYGSSHSGTFVVPEVEPGPTRMRIVSNSLNSTGLADPCAVGYANGEFEDYTFVIGDEALWDCPELEKNIGDSCDDLDPTTGMDMITEDCECVGTPTLPGHDCGTAIAIDCNADPVTFNSVGSTATNTTVCGMGDQGLWFTFEGTGFDILFKSLTSFDHEMSINSGSCGAMTNLGCSDIPIGINEKTFLIENSVEGETYFAYIGNWSTTVVTGDITVSIECESDAIYCPDLEAYVGDACDDGDPNTFNDTVNEDCECVGDPGEACENGFQFPSGTVDADVDLVTISTCNFYGDYSVISNIEDGQDYQFTATATTGNGYITVRVGAVDGPVLGVGYSPLVVTADADDNLYVHWNLDDDCGTSFSCVTTTVQQALYCPDLDDFAGAPCDDGDPNTINDVISADCVCEGTPMAANDEACTATAIACDESITQSLVGATSSFDDNCFGTGSADVWFTFESDGSQLLNIGETSSFDAVVQLFVGDDCEMLTEVEACSDFPESFEIAEAGTYYFRVRPYFSSGDESDITVTLECEEYDCPDLLGNIGDSCDDGDPDTVNDSINSDCECMGEAPGSCLNSTAFPSSAVEASEELVTITTCNFFGDYSEISNIQAGEDYEFTVTNNGYITVRSGGVSGAVIGSGYSPLTVTANSSGNLFVHWNSDDACGAASGCQTTTVQWIVGFDCPDLSLNIGDSCDDGDPNTVNDTVNENCVCEGVVPSTGGCDDSTEIVAAPEFAGSETAVSIAGIAPSADAQCINPDNPQADLWFSFTSVTTNMYVRAWGLGDFDAAVEVYDACGGTLLVCQNDEPAGEREVVIIPNTTVGETYHFRVYHAGDAAPSTEDLTVAVAHIPFTQLSDASCGEYDYYPGDIITSALPVNQFMLANWYFEFTELEAPYNTYEVLSPNGSNPNFNLVWFTQAEYGRTYSVRTRARMYQGSLWGDYGEACEIGIGITSMTTKLIDAHANGYFAMCDILQADNVPGAEGYRWKFHDGFETIVFDTETRFCPLSQVPGLNLGQPYAVNIRAYVMGELSPAGDLRLIAMDNFVPTTFVDENFTACGGTYPLSTVLSAEEICAAEFFTWRFTNLTDPLMEDIFYTRDDGLRTISLSWVTGLIPGHTYGVQILGGSGGMVGTYGPSCDITIEGGSEGLISDHNAYDNALDQAEISIYPNPTSGEEVMMNLSKIGNGQHEVIVQVYDLFGKQVYSDKLGNDGSEMNAVLRLDNLSKGIYSVTVIVDNTAIGTEKLVIQ